jgi:hypothetical protein
LRRRELETFRNRQLFLLEQEVEDLLSLGHVKIKSPGWAWWLYPFAGHGGSSPSPFSHCYLLVSRRNFVFLCIDQDYCTFELVLVQVRVALFIC